MVIKTRGRSAPCTPLMEKPSTQNRREFLGVLFSASTGGRHLVRCGDVDDGQFLVARLLFRRMVSRVYF